MGLLTYSRAPGSSARRASASFHNELKTNYWNIPQFALPQQFTTGDSRDVQVQDDQIGQEGRVGKHADSLLAIHRDMHFDGHQLLRQHVPSQKNISSLIFNKQNLNRLHQLPPLDTQCDSTTAVRFQLSTTRLGSRRRPVSQFRVLQPYCTPCFLYTLL